MTVTKIQSIPKITINKVRRHTKNFFFGHMTACGILVPPLQIELMLPCSRSTESSALDYQGSPLSRIFSAQETQSNHETKCEKLF